MQICFKEEQKLKAFSPINATEDGMFISTRNLHSLKEFSSIVIIEEGIVSFLSAKFPWNIFLFIEVIEESILYSEIILLFKAEVKSYEIELKTIPIFK